MRKTHATLEMIQIWAEEEREEQKRLRLSNLWGKVFSLLAFAPMEKSNRYPTVEPIQGVGDD